MLDIQTLILFLALAIFPILVVFLFDKILGFVIMLSMLLLAGFEQYQSINSNYIEIQPINESQYIECINGIEYIISNYSIVDYIAISNIDPIKIFVNQKNKQNSCVRKVYTYNEAKLKENKSKIFKEI